MSNNTITRNDLKNILNKALPTNNNVIKTIEYDVTIIWNTTSNPFYDLYTDIELDGWTPINLSYVIQGTYSSFVFPSVIEITKHNGKDTAHGYFRMIGQTPSTTTQNAVTWRVTYIKNANLTIPTDDTGWITLSTSSSAGTLQYRVVNKIVHIIGTGLNVTHNVDFATIPASIRPAIRITCSASYPVDKNIYVNLYSGGGSMAAIQNGGGAITNLFFNMSYPI